jgi:hypothetical protein
MYLGITHFSEGFLGVLANSPQFLIIRFPGWLEGLFIL